MKFCCIVVTLTHSDTYVVLMLLGCVKIMLDSRFALPQALHKGNSFVTQSWSRLVPRGGYSHKVGYAYARMARVWFSPISVLERVGFWKLVLERVLERVWILAQDVY